MQLEQRTPKNSHIAHGEEILLGLYPNSSPWYTVKHDVKSLKKDEIIYNTNDRARDIYIITEGRVKIGSLGEDKKDVIKSIFVENDIFGELAVTGELLRTDYAKSLEDNTKLYVFSAEDVLEAMKENQSLSNQVMHILGSRIRKTENRLASLLHKDARTRIIDFLRDWALEKGRKVGFETLIKNHFTHKDMASLTGTSRQTVTTVLNNLKEKNIINFDRRRILIRDMELLN
ncbi:MAG: CRP/FNR family cyclic AMP-dependent transcriptional regulator [Cyclobacteriaceae bacterium]|jgi:CRP-like cAMP-binding protein